MMDHMVPPERLLGPLTDEERAELEAWADTQGALTVMWRVYDDSDAFDQDEVGVNKAGEPHATLDLALDWAKEQDFTAWTVFRETRCVTRDREIWYAPGLSPVFSYN